MISMLLLASLGTGAYTIEGAIGCPSEPELIEALGEPPSGRELVLRLEAREGALHVALATTDGTTIAEHDLRGGGSCRDLAFAVASLVSAWTLEAPLPELLPAPRFASAAFVGMDDETRAPGNEPLRAAATPERSAGGHHAVHELGVSFATSPSAQYTQSTGVFAAYRGWWLSDVFAIEATAAVLSASNASSMQMVYTALGSGSTIAISDRSQLRRAGTLGALASVLRGWASPPLLAHASRTELYATLGVGLASAAIVDERLAAASGAERSTLYLALAFGAGMRFGLLGDGLGLTLEARDLVHQEVTSMGGVTHNVLLQAGLTASFDPDDWSFGQQPDTLTGGPRGDLRFTLAGGRQLLDQWQDGGALGLSAGYTVLGPLAIELAGTWVRSTGSSAFDELLEGARLMPPPAELTELRWAAGVGPRLTIVEGSGAPFGLDASLRFGLDVFGGLAFGATRTPCTPGLHLDPAVFGEGATCRMLQVGETWPAYEPNRTTLMGYAGAAFTTELVDGLGVGLEVRDWIFGSHILRPGASDYPDTEATKHTFLAQLAVSWLL